MLPLPEYPRPLLDRADWLNLNGPWQYAVIESDADDLAEQALPTEFKGEIIVPFAIETPASGVQRAFTPEQTLVYRRHIELPADWAGQQVALNFEAVDHECVIFLDGKIVGRHTGGYLPFSIVLPAGTTGGELVVAVRDPSDTGGQPYGKQALKPNAIWYTATSGIWGTVWAEPLPANPIDRVLAEALPGLDGFTITVDSAEPAGFEVEIELAPGRHLTAAGTTGSPLQVRVPEPRLWSPAEPHRYRLVVRSGQDRVESWAALRRVEIGPIPGARRRERDAVLLNGEPVFLNTPLDQGYWPETGMTPPTDGALVFDLEAMRELGFNGVRKHIKVESRRFYDHADRLGMLVVQDFVNGGRPRVTIAESRIVIALDAHRGDTSRRAHAKAGRRNARNRIEYEYFVAELIEHLRGHPSVVCWVIFNEAWGQYDTDRIEAWVRRLDPTRLIDAASGWYDQGGGDFRSRHRYVLPLMRPPRRDRRPYFISEFGGYNLALDNPDGTQFGYRFHTDAAALDKALAKLYRRQLIPLVRHGLRGAVYTQLSDIEIETNGLYSYDRQTRKVDAAALRVLNARLYAAFAKLGRVSGRRN